MSLLRRPGSWTRHQYRQVHLALSTLALILMLSAALRRWRVPRWVHLSLRAAVASSALAIASPHPSLLMTASTSATSSAVGADAAAIEGRGAERLGVKIFP